MPKVLHFWTSLRQKNKIGRLSPLRSSSTFVTSKGTVVKCITRYPRLNIIPFSSSFDYSCPKPKSSFHWSDYFCNVMISLSLVTFIKMIM